MEKVRVARRKRRSSAVMPPHCVATTRGTVLSVAERRHREILLDPLRRAGVTRDQFARLLGGSVAAVLLVSC